MSDFGAYTGEEFFQLQFPERKFLVDKIMRERDTVLLVGGEKSGKSLLVKQLIGSLTSGFHPFLDEFPVNKTCKVTYVQLEGELSDTQYRLKCMTEKGIDFDAKNFQLIFSRPLMLHTQADFDFLCAQIDKQHKPDVIIIDPLYFACVGGSLSDDMHVLKFTGKMRELKDRYGCSLLIVHHTHKVRLSPQGDVIQEGDDAVFGSTFLKAWPDHLLLFSYNKKTNYRHLTCATQRSGDIVRSLTLELVQPKPLYFRKHEDECGNDMGASVAILKYLQRPENSEGLPAEIIYHSTQISRPTFFRAIKPLLANSSVIKDSGRPVLYRVCVSIS